MQRGNKIKKTGEMGGVGGGKGQQKVKETDARLVQEPEGGSGGGIIRKEGNQ